MKQQDHRQPEDESSPDRGRGDQLVERMFSGFGHSAPPPAAPRRAAAQTPFHVLRQSRAGPGAIYRLGQIPDPRVQADSPATAVMTDLSRVAAVTTRSFATVDEAHRSMIAHGVRALFVVDAQATVLGILTSTDVLGEKPIQVAEQRGKRHDEVFVREVMTPADRLEAMDFEEVQRARVGDIVASLRQSGRQHALVIEAASADAASPARTVRGIFSLTQIARQLGLPHQAVHDVPRTFAEIEAAIGA